MKMWTPWRLAAVRRARKEQERWRREAAAMELRAHADAMFALRPRAGDGATLADLRRQLYVALDGTRAPARTFPPLGEKITPTGQEVELSSHPSNDISMRPIDDAEDRGHV